MNKQALDKIHMLKDNNNYNKNKLVIVPGATHLFEERGKLEQVASLAAKWLLFV
jgi:hypothetical protein